MNIFYKFIKFILAKNNQNVSHFLTFHSQYQILYLFFLLSIFIILKWPDLSLPIWGDEVPYLPITLWNTDWAFFLPWNYDPRWFMGHPFLHPFILYTAFSVFGPSVFVAKVTSLCLSLFFLWTLYKMTEAVFKCFVTAFYSVIFTLFLTLFWVYSSLILADIPAVAFGFGAIYALITRKYKSLLLFALGMGTIRESSLAFFVPLVLYGVAVPSYRKSLLYLTPGLVVFFLHFFIFFLKTGGWIAHPYITGTLYHNQNPEFFNFSIIPGNIRYYFLPLVLDIFPLIFFILVGIAIAGYIAMFCLNRKKKLSFNKEIFIPLCMCVLWFSFWIMYPDQIERNYFPLLFFLIPLGIHFIVKVIPYPHIFLIIICSFLFIQTALIKIHTSESAPPWLKHSYSQINILKEKVFIAYFANTYGNRIRDSKKIVWPSLVFLSYPQYKYIETPIGTEGDCLQDKNLEMEKYGAAIFSEVELFLDICIPFYKKFKKSDSFIQVKTPFENYQVFLHKNLL